MNVRKSLGRVDADHEHYKWWGTSLPEWQTGVDDPVRRRQILEQSLAYTARQLDLVRRRRDEISKLEDELVARRKRVKALLREGRVPLSQRPSRS